jgi:hypothetical protein
MIVNGDLAELWSLRDLTKAAMVVKTSLKFERASMMLLNCDRCGILTPEYVEKADNLHSLAWLKDDLVGELPPEWNYLVGYDDPGQGQRRQADPLYAGHPRVSRNQGRRPGGRFGPNTPSAPSPPFPGKCSWEIPSMPSR